MNFGEDTQNSFEDNSFDSGNQSKTWQRPSNKENHNY